MVGAGESLKILLFGDSIAYGIGVRGCSYLDIVSSALGAEVYNFAGSAMQISESKTRLTDAIKLDPDVIIIAHGVTEAVVRPDQASLRFVPQRWRKPGWMDPRPYYSMSFGKKVLQKAESEMRWRLKVLLIRFFGGTTWTSRDDYTSQLIQFSEEILQYSHSKIILLTPCGIDERYFPGSHTSMQNYLTDTLQVAKRFGDRITLCDVTETCDKWSDFFDDHFHPNANGHRKIGIKIAETINSLL